MPEIDPSYPKKTRELHNALMDSTRWDGFKGGLKTFVYKGTNGRWRDILTPEDLEKYDNVVNANLTPDCAKWHATGEMPD